MSDTSLDQTGHPAPASHGDGGHGDHSGPTDRQFVGVAVILGVLTALEFATYFTSVIDLGDFVLPVLLVLMSAKFYLVVAYFMHLKFDPKILRQLFVFGLSLAVVVYFVMLSAFRVFGSGGAPGV